MGQPEGKADAPANDKTNAGAPEADPDVARQFAREQQLPASQRHVARRRQYPPRHQPGLAGSLPDNDDCERQDPLNQAIGTRQSQAPDTWQAFDQAHDCEAFASGRCSLAMVSPNGPVLTRICVTLSGCCSDSSGNTSSAKR